MCVFAICNLKICTNVCVFLNPSNGIVVNKPTTKLEFSITLNKKLPKQAPDETFLIMFLVRIKIDHNTSI